MSEMLFHAVIKRRLPFHVKTGVLKLFCGSAPIQQMNDGAYSSSTFHILWCSLLASQNDWNDRLHHGGQQCQRSNRIQLPFWKEAAVGKEKILCFSEPLAKDYANNICETGVFHHTLIEDHVYDELSTDSRLIHERNSITPLFFVYMKFTLLSHQNQE